MTTLLTVAEMQLRELARRCLAMALLVALPLIIYLSVPASAIWAVTPAVVGLAWAVGGAAMFAALGWRRVDPRLSLAGYQPSAQILGRALPVTALGLIVGAAILPLVLVRSDLPDPFAIAVAVILALTVGTALGLVIGSLLPREMEAMLVLIGVGALSITMPPEIAAARVVPLWGPVRLLADAVETSGTPLTEAVTHSLLTTIGLGAITWYTWRRRNGGRSNTAQQRRAGA